MYENIKLIKTKDGSHTLYVPALDEHYHSVHGAVQESKHIYINAAYKYLKKKPQILNVLEIGFGTALNAILTLIESEKDDQKLNYYTIEAFPLKEEIYKMISFPELFKDKSVKKIFLKIHEAEWNVRENITDKFVLKKLYQKIENMILPEDFFDLVYFDAFAPDVQSRLWTEEIFTKIASSMKRNAVLTTYSAKGKIKRVLKLTGFEVENIPGPPGKREITRAIRK